jgi:glycerol-3-phosphate dehydrogenase (NAD(P)+)
MRQVAEGVGNCAIARDLARQGGVETPITEEVFAVIHEGKNPRDAVAALMNREIKPEL